MATVNVEKSLSLLRFLRECSALRRRRVARYEAHERVLWFANVPQRPPECQTAFAGGESGGVVLHVRKTKMPPRPAVPEAFRERVRPEHQEDLLGEPEIAPSHGEREGELAEVWRAYLAEAWRPWAAKMKAWREVQRVYDEVDFMRRRLEEADERYELVVAIGLLQWRDPSGAEVRRHLLTAPADVNFDASRGELAVEMVGPLRLELDMLEFRDQPNLDRSLLEPRISMLEPWNRESAAEVLRIIANQTSSTAQVEEDAMEPEGPADETMRVFYAPALVLRERRPTAYDEVVQRLIDRLSSGENVATTAPWERFLSEGELSHTGEVKGRDPASPGPTDRRIYFPLPTNDEQRAIIERLKAQPYVLVKGPPGTGKSLTIANLICHLLASGERVLVTAQAPKALAVLKDLLPEEIRKLCVNAIGSTRDEQSLLEESVRGILQRRESWQGAVWAENLVRRLESELKDLEAELSKIERRLREYREAETAKHSVGGGYEGTSAEIAKKVDAKRERFGWMPALAPDVAGFPLEAEQMALLARVHGRLSEARVKELSLELGEFDLPDPETFAAALRELEASERLWEEAQKKAPEKVVDFVASMPDEVVEAAKQFIAEFDEGVARLTIALRDTANEVVADLLAGRDTRWRQLSKDASELVRKMLARRELVGPAKVDVPAGLDRAQVLADARRRLEHFTGGGRRGWSVFMPRAVSETRYIEERCFVDGTPAADAVSLARVVAYLELEILMGEFMRLCSEVSLTVDESHLLRGVQDAAAFAEDLERFVRLFEGPGKTVLEHFPVKRRMILAEQDERDRFRASVELELAARRLARARERLAAWEESIRSIHQERRHPCMERLCGAIASRDAEQWASAYRQREELLEEQREYHEYLKLLDALGAACPGLPALLRQAEGDPAWRERLLGLREAWAWATARDWLKRRIHPEEYQALGEDWHRIHGRVLKKIEELAALKAWRAFFARLDDATQQSLIAWSAAVSRIGRDRGKFSYRHRKAAREYLAACIPKMPAWIMPLYRLWGTVDPEPGVFDTIIIDEASQAGIDSLLLLLLGKRIVVVGDDKQNSPEAVGIREEDVSRLAWEHLSAFRFREEFRLDTSLFDHALRSFGNPISLREHFRCVPEIIEFSNALCYEETPLIPLREPPPKRIPPLRSTYVEGAACEGRGPRLTNPAEAEALVETLVKCLRDEAYEGKTMGVIVLQGHAQAQLIEEKIVRRIDPRVREARKIRCGVPATFQGDERDVIFLSLVIAPNHEYRALTNLPEQRRFNVAMSRAREQVWLFHSVRLDELSPECLRCRLLQHFNPEKKRVDSQFFEERERLEREAREAVREKEPPPVPYDSWFEVDVAAELLRRNYRVRPKYQVAGRSIDLVIEGASRRLAIECDGGAWEGPEAYERELARQRQLERAGWTFVRLRESEFYVDRERAIERVVKVCERLEIFPVDREAAPIPLTTRKAALVRPRSSGSSAAPGPKRPGEGAGAGSSAG